MKTQVSGNTSSYLGNYSCISFALLSTHSTLDVCVVNCGVMFPGTQMAMFAGPSVDQRA